MKKMLPSNARNWNNYKDAEYQRELGVPHFGTDFAAQCGDKVVAPIGGTLYRVPANSGWASNTNGAGMYSLALYADDGTLHLFAHLGSNIIDYNDGYGGIENGSRVEIGQTIGTVGNLGFSTACHLHWQVLTKQIDQAFDVGYYPVQSGVDLTMDPNEWVEQQSSDNDIIIDGTYQGLAEATEQLRIYKDSEFNDFDRVFEVGERFYYKSFNNGWVVTQTSANGHEWTRFMRHNAQEYFKIIEAK